MTHEESLIAEIALGLGLAFVLGLLAARLRLPPLVGYLLLFLVVGFGFIFLFCAPGEFPVEVDRSLRRETSSLCSHPGARHRICSAGDQCLRVLVRTESMVRTRTARRGLCGARRRVLVGQNVVSAPLAPGLGRRLAPRSGA